MDAKKRPRVIELCEFRLIPRIPELVGPNIGLKVITPDQEARCANGYFNGWSQALPWGMFSVGFADPQNPECVVRFEIKRPATVKQTAINGSAELKLKKIKYWGDTSVELKDPEPFAVLRFLAKDPHTHYKCNILCLKVGIDSAPRRQSKSIPS
eukprot:m51a1_g12513 hypothetical protein (154) ;mRNA; f:341-895